MTNHEWLKRAAAVFGLGVVLTAGAPASAATRCDPVEVARRSTEARSINPHDRAKLAELGISNPTAATVVVRRVPKTENASAAPVVARLRSLAHAPAELAPSGACDSLAARGDSRAYCAGHVEGPIGRVPARMPVHARIDEGRSGAAELVIRNSAALEVKPLFSWSTVVAPEHLAIAYRVEDEGDAWRITTSIGVEMLAHAESARQLVETLLKVDDWLTRDLAPRF